jgi:hypothetical protein
MVDFSNSTADVPILTAPWTLPNRNSETGAYSTILESLFFSQKRERKGIDYTDHFDKG